MINLLNPYNLPKIKTGYDLLKFYNKLINKFKKNPPSLLLDHININLKFKPNGDDFIVVGDFGKNNEMDINGFTYIDINNRFKNNQNTIKIYKALFNVFTSAKQEIYPILKKLKLFQDKTILNLQFIHKNENNPETIIVVNDIYRYNIKHGERSFFNIEYDINDLNELVGVLQPYINNINLRISTPIKTKPLDTNLLNDMFNKILDMPYSIIIRPNFAITKNIRNWLRGCKNPFNKRIRIKDKKISLYNKSLYFKILNNIPLIDIVGKENLYNHKKNIIDAFILQLLNQALGQILLEHLVVPNKKYTKINGIYFDNTQILGDNILDKFNYMNEEEQHVISYISNPPHKTSDWGRQVPINEDYDLETTKNGKIFVNYIIEPKPFMQNDFDIYNQLSSLYPNHIITIIVPNVSDSKFRKIKETIKAYGISDEEIEEFDSRINPQSTPYGNNKVDKVLYIITDQSKKYLKPIKGYLKKFTNVYSMTPYIKHSYFKIVDKPKINLIEFKKIKNSDDFLNAYSKADDEVRNKLLIAMYNNTNLKTLFNKIVS